MNESASTLRYETLARELRKRLLSGEFAPGDRFPSLRNLVGESGRSLPTVRSALGLLVQEGLLERHARSGFFVTAKARVTAPRAKIRVAVVTPYFTAPSEPWFTGRIASGIVSAATRQDLQVVFVQRRSPPDARMSHHPDDLPRIEAEEPDAIIWLHYSESDAALVQQLARHRWPIATTMRPLPQGGIFVREDDRLFAAQVVTAFQALGHANIGTLVLVPEDDYYRSKLAALRAAARQVDLRVEPSGYFPGRAEADPHAEETVDGLARHLEAHPEISALLVLDSALLVTVEKLRQRDPRWRDLALLLNVLDGDNIAAMSLTEEVATITPPLELIGERLVELLCARLRREELAGCAPLAPVLRMARSLKTRRG